MTECTYRLSLEELLSRKALQPIFGSDGENEDEEKPEADSEDGAEGNDDGSDSEDDQEDGDDEEEPEVNPVIEGLTEARDRYLKQRNAARKERDEARGKLEKLTADGVKDDELKAELSAATKATEKTQAENKDLRIKLAFLTAKGAPSWKDANAALRLLDQSDIEIDEDGSVSGMDTALAKLKKSSPWLVNDSEKPKPKKSGDKPGGRAVTTAAQKAAAEAKLRAKFNIAR